MTNIPTRLAPLALALPLTLLTACDPDEAQAAQTAATDATVAQEHEPTQERLMERSIERAQLTCSGEWISVYDFIHPEIKTWMTVYQFLQGKDRHTYAEPTEPRLVGREGDTAYLSATVLWTPRIDVPIHNVEEDWDPTERIEWIETWEFAEGDWHMRWPPQDPGEFFEEHPDLLKKK